VENALSSGRSRAKALRRGRKLTRIQRGQLVDGRHLGCLQIPILFAENRVKRPSALDRVGTAQADRSDLCRASPWAPRKRGARRPVRPVDLARAGHAGATRARRSSRSRARAGSVRWDRRRRLVRLRPGSVVRHRSLQPMPLRFRDERCPSGSGWGEAPSSDPAFTRDPRAAQAALHDERRRAALLRGP
jgi:hypothetical protein